MVKVLRMGKTGTPRGQDTEDGTGKGGGGVEKTGPRTGEGEKNRTVVQEMAGSEAGPEEQGWIRPWPDVPRVLFRARATAGDATCTIERLVDGKWVPTGETAPLVQPVAAGEPWVMEVMEMKLPMPTPHDHGIDERCGYGCPAFEFRRDVMAVPVPAEKEPLGRNAAGRHQDLMDDIKVDRRALFVEPEINAVATAEMRKRRRRAELAHYHPTHKCDPLCPLYGRPPAPLVGSVEDVELVRGARADSLTAAIDAIDDGPTETEPSPEPEETEADRQDRARRDVWPRVPPPLDHGAALAWARKLDAEAPQIVQPEQHLWNAARVIIASNSVTGHDRLARCEVCDRPLAECFRWIFEGPPPDCYRGREECETIGSQRRAAQLAGDPVTLIEDAYRTGSNAYCADKDGVYYSENPHEPGTLAHTWWSRGLAWAAGRLSDRSGSSLPSPQPEVVTGLDLDRINGYATDAQIHGITSDWGRTKAAVDAVPKLIAEIRRLLRIFNTPAADAPRLADRLDAAYTEAQRLAAEVLDRDAKIEEMKATAGKGPMEGAPIEDKRFEEDLAEVRTIANYASDVDVASMGDLSSIARVVISVVDDVRKMLDGMMGVMKGEE